jgi:hypothetical protein
MALIPTRVHGVYDYVSGAALVAVPLLAAGSYRGAGVWVPVTLGVVAVVMSLMTRYELGLVKAVPMPVHLGMDVLAGAVLAASPWLFGFADVVHLPHLIAGLAEVGLALATSRVPATTLGTAAGTPSGIAAHPHAR